jgi:hypothetical protein
VIVSTATPENGEPVDVPVFNSKIPGVISTARANGCDAVMVDSFKLMTLADLADGVHPNWTGHAKIATAFYPELKRYLQGAATTPPPPPATPLISQTGNLVSGKAFSATAADSTTEVGNPLSNINDKNESTRWISVPQDMAALSTDLGSQYTLNKISVLWAADTVKNFDMQVSSDNSTWTTVASGVTNNTQSQLTSTTNFSNTPTGRYFRIVARDRWVASYGNSIFEIGVYGTAATTPAPPPPTALPGDVNGDTRVNALDLSALISHDGQSYAPADFNDDGTVGAADMAILLSKWTW